MVTLYELGRRQDDRRPQLIEMRSDKDNTLYFDLIEGAAEIAQYLWAETDICKYFSEYFIVAGLDDDNSVLGFYIVSKGKSNQCHVYIRNMLTFLSLVGASGCVGIHNHPTGDCTPSGGDRESYVQLKEQLSFMEIELKDDIVIGSSSFYSLNQGAEIKYDNEPY